MSDPSGKPNLKDPFLTKQLIAYIGNKRALLPFLKTVLNELKHRYALTSFIDPFAGSGAVSRLGKWLGFSVYANDWEEYAYIVNACHIGIDRRESLDLFSDRGGIDTVFAELNTLDEPESPYIGAFYAPRDTLDPDLDRERLFFTAENARFIDAVRERIESWYPGTEHRDNPERTILLSALIYQAATHANTSGVYKAFHRGFGGHNGDALKRIMSDMALQKPYLIDSHRRCEIHREDALLFAGHVSGDLCYLDPPYNQHQYGSNYHLLNTIALWDKPPAPLTVGTDGRLIHKAGIREDWKKTKSLFCSKTTAKAALHALIDRVDTRFFVLSYSTEGIIPFDEVYDLFNSEGKTELRSTEYTKYRGGRQSINRENRNIEFVIIMDRKRQALHTDRKKAAAFVLRRRTEALLTGSFDPVKIAENFAGHESGIAWAGMHLTMYRNYKFVDPNDAIKNLEYDELYEFSQMLAACRFNDLEEEASFLLERLAQETDSAEREILSKEFLKIFRKFTFKKYYEQWTRTRSKASALVTESNKDCHILAAGLTENERLAKSRFGG